MCARAHLLIASSQRPLSHISTVDDGSMSLHSTMLHLLYRLAYLTVLPDSTPHKYLLRQSRIEADSVSLVSSSSALQLDLADSKYSVEPSDFRLELRRPLQLSSAGQTRQT